MSQTMSIANGYMVKCTGNKGFLDLRQRESIYKWPNDIQYN